MSFTFLGYDFTEQGILTYAPKSSGVYGIYNDSEWIYVGEAEDIEARLCEHLRGQSDQSPCIKRRKPTIYGYERCDASTRLTKEKALRVELNPHCNKQ